MRTSLISQDDSSRERSKHTQITHLDRQLDDLFRQKQKQMEEIKVIEQNKSYMMNDYYNMQIRVKQETLDYKKKVQSWIQGVQRDLEALENEKKLKQTEINGLNREKKTVEKNLNVLSQKQRRDRSNNPATEQQVRKLKAGLYDKDNQIAQLKEEVQMKKKQILSQEKHFDEFRQKVQVEFQ